MRGGVICSRAGSPSPSACGPHHDHRVAVGSVTFAAAQRRSPTMTALTAREQREIDQANQSAKPPVVFVHGLWLLASSWANWREVFEERGFATLAPDWPDDPATVAEARKRPEVFAGKSVGGVTDHVADVVRKL